MRKIQVGRIACALVALGLAQASHADSWAMRYDGAGAGADTAKAVTLDSSGNIYVTGTSVGTGQNPGTTDMVTIKYSAGGSQLWASRFDALGKHNDGAAAIAVDSSGNVYVAGYSTGIGTGTDYQVVKYTSNGVQQWQVRDDNFVFGNDKIHGMVIDGSGNVYVTGEYCNSGSGDTDIRTIKYSSGGVEQWQANLSSGTGDAGYAIAVDASGNVYVAGRTGSAGSYNYRVIKYTSTGTQQWTATYNGPAGTNDEAYALAVDGSGNVYVTGYSNGSGSGSDYATVKFNSSGAQQWASRYNGTAGSSDEARSIAVDNSGNVYVTGASMDSGSTSGFATLRYNGSGTQQWVKREDSGLGLDGARKMVLHPGGDIYVCGDYTVSGQGLNLAYFRYDNNGYKMQSGTYNGPGGAADCGYGIAVVDSSKQIYVTGPSRGGSTDDFVTVKYDHIVLGSGTVSADVSGAAGQSKSLTATLTRSADSTGLSGRTISFTVDGVLAGSAVTNGSGVATLAYSIPSGTALGTQTISASFAGDTDYTASSDTSDLNVRKLSEITVWDRTGTITGQIPLRAYLKVGTYPYAGATIRFKIDGVQVGTAVTGANGVAIYMHTITEAVGSHTLSAEFDGDSQGAPVSSSAYLIVVKIIKAEISVASLTMAPGRTANLRAWLRGGSTMLANKSLTFKVDGVSVGDATTDANGRATLAHVITEALGDHPITVEFAGEAGLYSASTGNGMLVVMANTRIAADRISATAGTPVTYGASLFRTDTNTGMAGRTLSFYDGATLLGTAVTDANGRAEISLNAPAQGVTQNITVRFGGEATFRLSEKMGRIVGL